MFLFVCHCVHDIVLLSLYGLYVPVRGWGECAASIISRKNSFLEINSSPEIHAFSSSWAPELRNYQICCVLKSHIRKRCALGAWPEFVIIREPGGGKVGAPLVTVGNEKIPSYRADPLQRKREHTNASEK